MLSELVTGVRWRLLKRLVEADGSLSALARETDTTKANTFRALKELEKEDVIRKTVMGRTHLYRFNFLHPAAETVLVLIMEEKRDAYNRKLEGLPALVDGFLRQPLGEKYGGCIFFGSSISGAYRDIDVFVIAAGKEAALKEALHRIDKRLSPLFGTREELENGLRQQDMLYKNVVSGVGFSVDPFPLRYREAWLKKQDIRERFVLGLREIVTCLAYPEQSYQKVHLERGVRDFMYAVLAYFDLYPQNDHEADALFTERLKERKPRAAAETLSLMKRYSWIL